MAEKLVKRDYEAEIARLKGLLGDKEIKTRSESSLDTIKSAEQAKAIEGQRAVIPAHEGITGPLGLDIGTTHIVMSWTKDKYTRTSSQLNAFFTVPYSNFTKNILLQNNINFFEYNNNFYISGFEAEDFANMFNTNTRRPIEKGLLSTKEEEGIKVLQTLLNLIVPKSKDFGEVICFSVPGEPLDDITSVVYHESLLKLHLGKMGYTPIPINEGLAVVMSELGNENFTGIGISMGGGMCNVCFSYLSVPVITYSIQKGGDYIDMMVGSAVGEPSTKIKNIKETALDLTKEPANRVETALHIFYDDIINSLLNSLHNVLTSSDRMPKISNPITIVLSGGAVLPLGCKEKFERALKVISLPVNISSVRVAEDPLKTTSKGALIKAKTEEI